MSVRGFISRADPRVKVLWVVACNVAAIVAPSPEALALIVANVVVAALAGGVLLRVVTKFKGFWLLMLVIGIIQGLTVTQGDVVLYLIPRFIPVIGGSLPVYGWGLYYGLISVLRLFALTMPVFIVVETTSISEFVVVFNWLGLPYEYSLMLSLAMSFIPLFLSELSSMLDSLKARGCELVDNPIKRVCALKYVLIPLSLNAVERADAIGRILEMRGYMKCRGLVTLSKGCRASTYLLLLLTLLLGVSVFCTNLKP